MIGHEFDAAHDILRISFSSLWMLSNALRAINAGWVFQLNGDVTGSCECCSTMAELIQHPEVVHFTTTTYHAEGRLPVHTAMCDNFKGWGNFAMDSLGIETN